MFARSSSPGGAASFTAISRRGIAKGRAEFTEPASLTLTYATTGSFTSSSLIEQDSGGTQMGQQAQVSIANSRGTLTGTGGIAWTAFSYHETQQFPNGSGQCYGTGAATNTIDGARRPREP